MTITVLSGQRTWSLQRDDEGHRTYTIKHLVKSEITDGPANVIQAAGLPQIGDQWNFDGDLDVWAFCRPSARVSIHQEKEGDPNRWWVVEQTFSTKPLKRCQDETIEDPLLEPQRVSGSFIRQTEEAQRDRFGDLIVNTAFELFRGPNVEFDVSRPTVSIEQNVADLELPLLAEMANTVNDTTLWGLPPRTIKISSIAWERVLYGVCNFYFKRKFEFDINYDTFDRELLNEGTKALHGEWAKDAADLANACRGAGTANSQPAGSDWKLICIDGEAPDPSNPQHFSRYKDRNGENTRCLLDENGEPLPLSAGTQLIDPLYITVEKYIETDFTLLGLPTDLAVSL